jgi:hypothetical protein
METDLDTVLNQPVVSPQVNQPVEEPIQISNKSQGEPMKLPVVIGVFLLLIAVGVGTGWGISTLTGSSTGTLKQQQSAAPGTLTADEVVVGQVYGSDDQNRFKDISEGVVAEGGIDGEGTHHLVRPGGASQTVYLTSSVVDLDLFIGHKVQLRGETFSAQKAAWFMDVGSVKVVELNAEQAEELPTE